MYSFLDKNTVDQRQNIFRVKNKICEKCSYWFILSTQEFWFFDWVTLCQLYVNIIDVFFGVCQIKFWLKIRKPSYLGRFRVRANSNPLEQSWIKCETDVELNPQNLIKSELRKNFHKNSSSPGLIHFCRDAIWECLILTPKLFCEQGAFWPRLAHLWGHFYKTLCAKHKLKNKKEGR